MNTPAFTRLAAGIVFLCLGASAATYYVDLNNTTPASPFGGWSTAATNIQDAIDLATDGDLILVTNGTYATGGRPFYGSLTNRVVIDKAVTVQSVNGPAVTIIQGNPVLDDTAVRCVYMTNGASLIGFTLTQGATRNFQGDMYLEWRGGGAYCESTNAMISNCVFSANSAANGGGGIIGGTLESCILSSNATTVNYLGGNGGGGALASTLNHCVLIGNSAYAFGGGADSCTLNFCVLGGNTAGDSGGGVIGGTLNNCILTNNSAGNVGGGADGATLNNCNLTGNSAYAAGGAVYGTLNNCIVYYNQAIDPYSPNYDATAMNRCCTTPHAGTGNFTNEPLFVNYASGDFHLQSGSFCINAGDNASVATGVDWDGNPRVVGTYVDVGAFEYQSAAPLPLSASAFADFTNVASGFVVNLIGEIGGHETLSFWDLGDGTFVTNQLNLSHSWSAAGDYTVTLTAYDSDHPSGVSASLMFHVLANAVYYVALDNGTPEAPYSSWATAANSIQDAVDAAYAGATVWVSNGVYQTGGKITTGGTSNRVAVTAPVRIQSINGPALTIIKGYTPPTTNSPASVRCVYLSNGASLSGFTLTNGSTYFDVGGGAKLAGGSLSNCVVVGNSAKFYGGGVFAGFVDHCFIKQNFALNGGGVAASKMINSLVISNTATVNGGGTFAVNATNCTVVGNFAALSGGGTYQGAIQNSIVYFNSIGAANANATNYSGSTMSFCCTKPSALVGNVTNDPAFANLSGADYHLTAVSPCINAGMNIFASGAIDLEGNPRVMFGNVDLGAYEFQSKVHYVKPPSTGVAPVSPYTNWITAATNIQNAIDASGAGDFVVVSNGFYNSGGRVVVGTMTNRIVVTNGVKVVSLNGASTATLLGGTQMRCAYVGSNSMLSGFTITNGHASTSGDLISEKSGGGIWCESGGVVANSLIISNTTIINTGYGGGAYGGVFSNCSFIGNSSAVGGAAARSDALWNCFIFNNIAGKGAGAYSATLRNSVLSQNSVVYNSTSSYYGGGAAECLAYDCVFTGNFGYSGGGATYLGTNFSCMISNNSAGGIGGGTYQSTNYNCILTGNSAATSGGGAYQGALYNCVVIGNIATNSITGNGGGGAYGAILVNCTVAGNFTTAVGGGINGGSAYNTVVYSNTAASGGPNWTNNPVMYYCCTTPLPGFSGNITNSPLFVDAAGGDYRLKCGSPCIDAGATNGIVISTTNDIRGALRPLDGGSGLAKFDIGAYEYNPAEDPTPNIRPLFDYRLFSTSLSVGFVAQIGGCADYFWWDFGDGTTVTNQSSVTHAWTSPGAFDVRLWAVYGGSNLSAATSLQLMQQPIFYVNASNATPAAPYTNWTKAATSIQQAVAIDSTPGRLVLVTNGTYRNSAGTVNGILANCVALTNCVLVQSINGAQATIIQPITFPSRCAYIGSNAILSGFTLTGGSTRTSGDTNNDQSGAGVWCEPGGAVSNCLFVGNLAACFGGGAYQGSFFNCIFTNNRVVTTGSTARGGAAYLATLNDCLLISNKVSSSFPGGKGGGSYGGSLSNCFVIGNVVDNGDLNSSGGGVMLGTLYNCVLEGNSGSGYGGASCSNVLWNCSVSNNWANYGGGGYASTYYNSLVVHNRAGSQGGGAHTGTFYNSTVAQNTAPTGAGVYTLMRANDSIIYGNTNVIGATDNVSGSNFGGSNNCIYPQSLPVSGGNITNDPAFVDSTNGDFRLQPISRCINSGANVFVFGATDLNGNPRIRGGTVDMGAFEFQSDVAGTFTNWLQSYGLPTDGSGDYADSDDDGANSWQEWIAGTIPTDAASVLRLLSANPTNDFTQTTITWQSVAGKNYSIERASDLSVHPAFSLIDSNIVGQSGTTSYTDTNAIGNGPFFYRVGVQ